MSLGVFIIILGGVIMYLHHFSFHFSSSKYFHVPYPPFQIHGLLSFIVVDICLSKCINRICPVFIILTYYNIIINLYNIIII